MTTRSGDEAGFLLPARPARSRRIDAAHQELFAHFLRKTNCAAPKSAGRRNYFRGRRAASPDMPRLHAPTTAARREAGWRNARAIKSAEKKQFRNSRDDAAAGTRERRRAVCVPARRPAQGWIAAAIENNSPKVLTVEKTVIRFRAADMTCGRE